MDEIKYWWWLIAWWWHEIWHEIIETNGKLIDSTKKSEFSSKLSKELQRRQEQYSQILNCKIEQVHLENETKRKGGRDKIIERRKWGKGTSSSWKEKAFREMEQAHRNEMQELRERETYEREVEKLARLIKKQKRELNEIKEENRHKEEEREKNESELREQRREEREKGRV